MKWVKKKLSIITSLFLFTGFFFLLSKIDWEIFSTKSGGCVFCSEKVLHLNTFYEGNYVLGCLTHKPSVEGHVLVLPKRHVVRFEELTNQELIEIKQVVEKIDRASRKKYASTGYLLLQKNGKEAGQSVPHVHFHYFPRKVSQSQFACAAGILLRNLFTPLSILEMREKVEEMRFAIEENQNPQTVSKR